MSKSEQSHSQKVAELLIELADMKRTYHLQAETIRKQDRKIEGLEQELAAVIKDRNSSNLRSMGEIHQLQFELSKYQEPVASCIITMGNANDERADGYSFKEGVGYLHCEFEPDQNIDGNEQWEVLVVRKDLVYEVYMKPDDNPDAQGRGYKHFKLGSNDKGVDDCLDCDGFGKVKKEAKE